MTMFSPRSPADPDRWSRVFAALAGWLWFASLFAPVDDMPGIMLAFLSFSGSFSMPAMGPWAALANLTIPWACIALVRRAPDRAALPVGLTCALVATSPGFWAMQTMYAWKACAVPLWTASIVLMIASWWGPWARQRQP